MTRLTQAEKNLFGYNRITGEPKETEEEREDRLEQEFEQRRLEKTEERIKNDECMKRENTKLWERVKNEEMI